MAGLLALGVLLTLFGNSQAVPDQNYPLLEDFDMDLEHMLSSDLPQIKKRDLEFNQYVPAYRLRGEPSCEELRAMWRLSKREARRATSTNNLPRSRPYSYGRLIAFAPSTRSRTYAYAEPRNFASQKSPAGFSPVKGSFNRLRAMLGVGAGRPGSYQKVEAMVGARRLPGETSKGKFNELRDMVVKNHLSKNSPENLMVGSPSVRSSDVYQPVRRTPSAARFQIEQRQSQSPSEGFVGPLLAANPAIQTSALTSGWKNRVWNPRTVSLTIS